MNIFSHNLVDFETALHNLEFNLNTPATAVKVSYFPRGEFISRKACDITIIDVCLRLINCDKPKNTIDLMAFFILLVIPNHARSFWYNVNNILYFASPLSERFFPVA